MVNEVRVTAKLARQKLGGTLGDIDKPDLRFLTRKRPQDPGADALCATCDNDRPSLKIRVACASRSHRALSIHGGDPHHRLTTARGRMRGCIAHVLNIAQRLRGPVAWH